MFDCELSLVCDVILIVAMGVQLLVVGLMVINSETIEQGRFCGAVGFFGEG